MFWRSMIVPPLARKGWFIHNFRPLKDAAQGAPVFAGSFGKATMLQEGMIGVKQKSGRIRASIDALS
jgi:hypothetical protein